MLEIDARDRSDDAKLADTPVGFSPIVDAEVTTIKIFGMVACKDEKSTER